VSSKGVLQTSCLSPKDSFGGEKWAFVSFGLQKKEIYFLFGFRINRKIGVLIIICPLIALVKSLKTPTIE
jgi:hypothetical protein